MENIEAVASFPVENIICKKYLNKQKIIIRKKTNESKPSSVFIIVNASIGMSIGLIPRIQFEFIQSPSRTKFRQNVALTPKP